MFVLLLSLFFLTDQLSGFELELDINEEETYGVLDEASAEVDEFDDVLLSCNENAEIYTKSTIKNLFRSSHFNRADSDDQRTIPHVLGWQVLNEQKHFTTNSTYLLMKQTSPKDSGIYYCIFRVPYLSFFSSILPSALVSNLSRLWAGCHAVGQFECLASFKYKLMVRKTKRRFLNPMALPEDFKERCLVIKNGKQIVHYKTLSLIAMFLASMIFFLLLFYFISVYRDSFVTGQKLSKKNHKKHLKRLRSEQIDENLKIIKSFEQIKEDEQELLRKLRLEQERLSSKRREDEEFFNKIKNQELELVKRKEEVVKEEEELLRKRVKFESEQKAKELKATEERAERKQKSVDVKLTRQPDGFRVRPERKSSSEEREVNIKNFKDLDDLDNRPISLNIKGEIKLKPPPRSCDENKQLVELNDFAPTSAVLDLNELSKKIKKSRKSIFSPDKSPGKLRAAHKQIREKYRDPLKLRVLNNLDSGKKEELTDKRRPNLDRLNKDRKAFLKRRLMAATHIGVNNNFRDDFRKEFNLNERHKLGHRSLSEFRMEHTKEKSRPGTSNGMLEVEGTIDILKRNESIFKTKGKFKMDPKLCDKPIQMVVECGPLSPNKAGLTK